MPLEEFAKTTSGAEIQAKGFNISETPDFCLAKKGSKTIEVEKNHTNTAPFATTEVIGSNANISSIVSAGSPGKVLHVGDCPSPLLLTNLKNIDKSMMTPRGFAEGGQGLSDGAKGDILVMMNSIGGDVVSDKKQKNTGSKKLDTERSRSQ